MLSNRQKLRRLVKEADKPSRRRSTSNPEYFNQADGSYDPENFGKCGSSSTLTDTVGGSQDSLSTLSDDPKRVNFRNEVVVILIPEVKEYKAARLHSLLWWNEEDLLKFKEEGRRERKIAKTIASLHEIELENSPTMQI